MQVGLGGVSPQRAETDDSQSKKRGRECDLQGMLPNKRTMTKPSDSKELKFPSPFAFELFSSPSSLVSRDLEHMSFDEDEKDLILPPPLSERDVKLISRPETPTFFKDWHVGEYDYRVPDS